MKTINIIDVGCDRYTIKSDCYCLGRQWDNEAEEIKVVRPARETGNVCTMIVSADGEVIDHIDIKDEPKLITNVLSRHLNVEISFTFTNESDYVKNSEIKSFYFAEARKPEDFVPVEPEQTGKIDVLLGNGFVRAELVNGVIHYFNANGDKVQDLDISKVGGKIDSISVNGVPQIVDKNKNVDLKITTEETDPTVPDWAKQPKKPTYSYEEITNKPTLFSGSYNDLKDKPTIPSINGLASETYVNNKASTTLQQSKSYTDTKVANLVGSAPQTLDTLEEVANALKQNDNVVTALNNAIGNKQNSTDYNLQTSAKTIVGAINEINDRLSSAGTQLQNILGV
jgi:hypothetical protein